MDAIKSEWARIENFVGHNVPMFLKVLLWRCGYDSMVSIKQISSVTIDKLEQYIQKKRNQIVPEILLELENVGDNDNSLMEYKNQKMFEFLPGHRETLLCLRSNIEKMQLKSVSESEDCDEVMAYSATDTIEYSVILKELIKTADKNFKKSKHAYQYNDIIKYFSTYIFLLCGRTCYETLNKNLPIPSTKTICK